MLQYPKTKLLFFHNLAYYLSSDKKNSITIKGKIDINNINETSNINVTPCIFELLVLCV